MKAKYYVELIIFVFLFFATITYLIVRTHNNTVNNGKKIFKNETQKVKYRVKDYYKQGKYDYMMFKKYMALSYLYHHNEIALGYLKKGAYEGYYKAEYDYAKFVFGYKPFTIYRSGMHYMPYSNLKNYAEAIEFIKLSAKQGYKPALFQLAMLYRKGGYVAGERSSIRGLYFDRFTLHLRNQKKAKKILYLLASENYKPAIEEVNKLYNN
jgi:TPR repeat protein